MNLRLLRIFTLGVPFLAIQGAADEARRWPTEKWATAAPESQQVDNTVLEQLDREFASGKHGNVDGMFVYRKEYAIDYDRLFADQDETPGKYNYHDADWHPWHDHGDLHTIQSISNSADLAYSVAGDGQACR
jgi:hypothetical protein